MECQHCHKVFKSELRLQKHIERNICKKKILREQLIEEEQENSKIEITNTNNDKLDELLNELKQLKDENKILKSSIQKLKVDTHKYKKVSKKKKTQGQTIKESIINILLSSPLNIDTIPDDIEAEMYNAILDSLETSCNPFRFFCKS